MGGRGNAGNTKLFSNIHVERNRHLREARAKELAGERAAKPLDRHEQNVQRINEEVKRVVPALANDAKISDNKWSSRELKDVRDSLSTSEMFSGLRASKGATNALAAAAVYGAYSNALTHSRHGDEKSLKRQAQYESLAKRIVSEGIPRSIVESHK